MQHQARVAGQLPGLLVVERLARVQLRHLVGTQLDLGDPGPPGVARLTVPVLVGDQAHRGGLDPQRHVLGHEGDVVALRREGQRHREDARVVGLGAEAGRQDRRIGVVELHPNDATRIVDGDGDIETAVRDPQVIEPAQGLARERPDLGVVSLALQFGDHHQRQHDLVLREPDDRRRVREQHGRVENDDAAAWRGLLARVGGDRSTTGGGGGVDRCGGTGLGHEAAPADAHLGIRVRTTTDARARSGAGHASASTPSPSDNGSVGPRAARETPVPHQETNRKRQR